MADKPEAPAKGRSPFRCGTTCPTGLQWVRGRITPVMEGRQAEGTGRRPASMSPGSDNPGYVHRDVRRPEGHPELQWVRGRITPVMAGTGNGPTKTAPSLQWVRG